VSDNENENVWKSDDASQARTTTALAEVDARQAAAPRCGLCGQRVRWLDDFGLCSKVSPSHEQYRATGRFR
jgi:hypothetical protein